MRERRFKDSRAWTHYIVRAELLFSLSEEITQICPGGHVGLDKDSLRFMASTVFIDKFLCFRAE